MSRFGSALARASQYFGNRDGANAEFRRIIKQMPGQRPSSLNGMNMVSAFIPGRLGQQKLERRNPRLRRPFYWRPGLNFGIEVMEKTND